MSQKFSQISRCKLKVQRFLSLPIYLIVVCWWCEYLIPTAGPQQAGPQLDHHLPYPHLAFQFCMVGRVPCRMMAIHPGTVISCCACQFRDGFVYLWVRSFQILECPPLGINVNLWCFDTPSGAMSRAGMSFRVWHGDLSVKQTGCSFPLNSLAKYRRRQFSLNALVWNSRGLCLRFWSGWWQASSSLICTVPELRGNGIGVGSLAERQHWSEKPFAY